MLENYIQQFLSYIENIRGYSQSSIKTYAIALSQMAKVSEFYEEDGVWQLDITKFRIFIKDQNSKTISKKLSAVRSFVKYLQQQKQLPTKLLASSSIKTAQTLPKPVDKVHIDRALAVADKQTALMIELTYALGLRISELQNLEVSHISDSWVEVVGKGDKMRNIPLIQTTKQKVVAYIQSSSPKKFLFEQDGAKLSQNSIRYRLQKVFKAVGIKVTPHQLRHSFATDLLENGARIKDVSELLGHSSLSATQIYTKLSRGKKMQTYLQSHPLCGQDN